MGRIVKAPATAGERPREAGCPDRQSEAVRAAEALLGAARAEALAIRQRAQQCGEQAAQEAGRRDLAQLRQRLREELRQELRAEIEVEVSRRPSEARPCGTVTALAGLAVRARLPGARIGDLVTLDTAPGASIPGEIVGFRGDEIVVLPLGEVEGLCPGARVLGSGQPLTLRVGPALIGRVLDALGRPIDGRALPGGLAEWPAERSAPGPLQRGRISRPLPTGLRAVDGPLALAEGQRIGLFAGAGAGKSTLLGLLARQARADAVVVALVGERGREVREFIEEILGPDGMARSVVVVATSDAPARLRLQAARTATALAEWLADAEGRSVLLLVDSLTRFARAQREAGLAAGEPPVRQGNPPSVFAALPRLLERAGPRPRGCITGVYSVLLSGGDLEEPVGEEARSLLDGHLVLDARLAGRGWFPAIDVPRSLSRLMPAVAGPEQCRAAARLRELLDALERVRDLLAVGAYAPGGDPAADLALARQAEIEAFLRQAPGAWTDPAETRARLEALAS